VDGGLSGNQGKLVDRPQCPMNPIYANWVFWNGQHPILFYFISLYKHIAVIVIISIW